MSPAEMKALIVKLQKEISKMKQALNHVAEWHDIDLSEYFTVEKKKDLDEGSE